MTFSVGDAIKQGWEIFKSRPWFFIGACIILFIASVVIGLLTEAIDSVLVGDTVVNPEDPSQGTVIGNLVNFLLSTLVNMGAVAFFLKSYDDLPRASYGDLWHPQSYLQYLAVTVLFGLMIGLGLILLIVPGLIALVVFFFAPFLVIDRLMGPIEALKASMEITKGHRWTLFGLILAIAGINILGALALFVGLFVTIPVTTMAIVYAYRTLSGGAGMIRAPADATL
ncbi:hypothetical protein A7A08_00051 [Methyloligella halotolerans]|uniref:Glycerophosphoryl diester phosphodiesterase membrane domain-containing protein n=1 Tax=Methyloligella halotolerans TaxID=1177755 RepID=A0A1E2S1A8_9HYPH|nr:DUF975 family protein [Methyloligella halotolerans]ODA68234.1 hypothetical protein A7A08_00051 [Methyloligella halotolerans]